jgi:hypothetical protein
MTIQTSPDMFNQKFPVHTVTHIDRATGLVTLTGSDRISHEVPLSLWGPFEAAQPVVGSKVQLLL